MHPDEIQLLLLLTSLLLLLCLTWCGYSVSYVIFHSIYTGNFITVVKKLKIYYINRIHDFTAIFLGFNIATTFSSSSIFLDFPPKALSRTCRLV